MVQNTRMKKSQIIFFFFRFKHFSLISNIDRIFEQNKPTIYFFLNRDDFGIYSLPISTDSR